jgi:hypothetical protein
MCWMSAGFHMCSKIKITKIYKSKMLKKITWANRYWENIQIDYIVSSSSHIDAIVELKNLLVLFKHIIFYCQFFH